MRAFPMMRELGVPGHLRRHPQPAAAGRRRRRHGRPRRSTSSRSARAGVAAGVDGVFLEVHEDPTRAKSDAQNALRLDAARRAAPAARRASTPSCKADASDGEATDAAMTRRSHSPARCCASRRTPSCGLRGPPRRHASRGRCDSCTSAAAASSSPAWASRASSAARSRRRCRAPARRRSSCTRPRRSTATSAPCRRDDVVVALSHSGETERTPAAARDDPPGRRHADRDHRHSRRPRSARPPTSPSTAASTRRPAR